MQVPPNYGPAYVREFDALFADVAKANKVPLVPSSSRASATHDMFQPDRIHPTAAAQPMLLDNVWPALRLLLIAAMIEAATPGRDRRVTVDAIGGFAERIDVRSPAEYAEDHLPGAVNLPVLDDDERTRVGTLHAQDSAFAARRAGAALVARNIATIARDAFAAKPRDWAPVVYCWRGGKRSASLAHVLNEIGWRAVQLEGGYRT